MEAFAKTIMNKLRADPNPPQSPREPGPPVNPQHREQLTDNAEDTYPPLTPSPPSLPLLPTSLPSDPISDDWAARIVLSYLLRHPEAFEDGREWKKVESILLKEGVLEDLRRLKVRLLGVKGTIERCERRVRGREEGEWIY